MNAKLITPIVIAIAVPAVLAWLYRLSSKQKAIQTSGMLIFPGAKASTAMIWFSIVLFSALAVISSFYVKSNQWWVPVLFLGFVALGVFGFVPTLTLDEQGIASQVWYSRKQFLWSQVAKLQFTPGNRTFTVFSADGKKIECSGFHADADRFRTEVLRRTRLPLLVRTPGVVKMNVSELSNQDALQLDADVKPGAR